MPRGSRAGKKSPDGRDPQIARACARQSRGGVRGPAANLQDRDGAALVLDQIDEPPSQLELIWADGGDAGDKLQDWMQARFGPRPLRLEVVRRSDAHKGFVVLPRRWVVERTFGWLHNFRRLRKDYEFRTDSSEAFIFLAASRLLSARLARL